MIKYIKKFFKLFKDDSVVERSFERINEDLYEYTDYYESGKIVVQRVFTDEIGYWYNNDNCRECDPLFSNLLYRLKKCLDRCKTEYYKEEV